MSFCHQSPIPFPSQPNSPNPTLEAFLVIVKGSPLHPRAARYSLSFGTGALMTALVDYIREEEKTQEEGMAADPEQCAPPPHLLPPQFNYSVDKN